MHSIVFLGAPSQAKLNTTWDPSFLEESQLSLSQRPEGTAWRRLPDELLHARADDPDVALYPSTSYLVPLNDIEATVSSHADESERDHSFDSNMSSSILLTQPHLCRFDPAKVLEIEDLLASPIFALGTSAQRTDGHAITYSFMAAVLQTPVLEYKTTKSAAEPIPFVRLVVGDVSVSGFEVACWGSYALTVSEQCRARDIVLFENLLLSDYKGVIQAKTRRQQSALTLLYRVDARFKQDHRLQPTLLDDAQSQRVRQVRDWVMQWIPKDAGQPADETQPLPESPDDTFGSTRSHLSLQKMPAT
jgi:hypothetical protein